MKVLNVFSISYFAVQYVQCQYVSFQQQQGRTKNNVCEGVSNTSLIEHFFNLIFSEFHNHPPVCVCVQMCVEQPTYCYPNGCFKKVEPMDNKKRHAATAQVSQVQQDTAKPMSFLVDSQSDFMENLLTMKPAVADNKPVKLDHSTFNELFRDPFKDRYQSIFKYKKSPKVHLKYNLREQVKHKKTDLIKIEKIDVSKTRWPAGEGNQYYTDKQKQINKDSNRYFHSDLESGSNYPTKFFKRDLTKKFDLIEHNFDKVENTTEIFSLENLIENLIESSFGPLTNETELDLNVNLDYSVISNATTIEPIITPYKRSLLGNKIMLIINETTNVVSINNTNENLDENKYNDDDSKGQMYKNVFNDMIASLSKHIEKNNNSSIEMMEQVLGHRVKDVPNFVKSSEDSVPTPELPFMDDISVKTSTNNIETTSAQQEEYTSTTEVTTEESTEPELNYERQEVLETTAKEGVGVTKKSHQVLTRKLYNSKPN